MNEYPKIQSIYKRDPENKYKTFINKSYSLPEFDYLKNNKWIFTEKVDGTNIRVLISHYGIVFKGKTDKAELHPLLLNSLVDIFKETNSDIFQAGSCLYGEGYGEKIQSGGKYRKGQGFVLFDAFINGYWLRRPSLEELAATLNLEIAPVIGSGTLDDLVDMGKRGFESAWGDFVAEGIVARPEVPLYLSNGTPIMTKVKFIDFPYGQAWDRF